MTHLEQLPERIDQLTSQLVQLRGEMRDEFSAVREEIAARITSLREEVGLQFAGVREDIEETRRHMRVLHEDVISRLATIQEGQGAGRQRAKRKPRRRN